jgi:hypothetical protein
MREACTLLNFFESQGGTFIGTNLAIGKGPYKPPQDYTHCQDFRTEPYSKRRELALIEFAEILLECDVGQVGGPVLSGALISQTICTLSWGQLRPLYIPKEGYRPRQHTSSFRPGIIPWIWIDDVIASGQALIESAEQLKQTPPIAIFTFQYFGSKTMGKLADSVPNWKNVQIFKIYQKENI